MYNKLMNIEEYNVRFVKIDKDQDNRISFDGVRKYFAAAVPGADDPEVPQCEKIYGIILDPAVCQFNPNRRD